MKAAIHRERGFVRMRTSADSINRASAATCDDVIAGRAGLVSWTGPACFALGRRLRGGRFADLYLAGRRLRLGRQWDGDLQYAVSERSLHLLEPCALR